MATNRIFELSFEAKSSKVAYCKHNDNLRQHSSATKVTTNLANKALEEGIKKICDTVQ